MPRFFFHVHDGVSARDDEGTELPDWETAPFEDWRLSPAERAADLVARMSPDEKLGLMVISSRPMGISQHIQSFTPSGSGCSSTICLSAVLWM